MAKSMKEGCEIIPATVTYNMPPKTAAEIAENRQRVTSAISKALQLVK